MKNVKFIGFCLILLMWCNTVVAYTKPALPHEDYERRVKATWSIQFYFEKGNKRLLFYDFLSKIKPYQVGDVFTIYAKSPDNKYYWTERGGSWFWINSRFVEVINKNQSDYNEICSKRDLYRSNVWGNYYLTQNSVRINYSNDDRCNRRAAIPKGVVGVIIGGANNKDAILFGGEMYGNEHVYVDGKELSAKMRYLFRLPGYVMNNETYFNQFMTQSFPNQYQAVALEEMLVTKKLKCWWKVFWSYDYRCGTETVVDAIKTKDVFTVLLQYGDYALISMCCENDLWQKAGWIFNKEKPWSFITKSIVDQREANQLKIKKYYFGFIGLFSVLILLFARGRYYLAFAGEWFFTHFDNKKCMIILSVAVVGFFIALSYFGSDDVWRTGSGFGVLGIILSTPFFLLLPFFIYAAWLYITSFSFAELNELFKFKYRFKGFDGTSIKNFIELIAGKWSDVPHEVKNTVQLKMDELKADRMARAFHAKKKAYENLHDVVMAEDKYKARKKEKHEH